MLETGFNIYDIHKSLLESLIEQDGAKSREVKAPPPESPGYYIKSISNKKGIFQKCYSMKMNPH